MTKQEFLNSLRAALSSRIGASLVEENVRYYEDYINTQMRMGKSEEQVIGELGDPRLLARSIADANKRAGMSDAKEAYEDADAGRSGSYRGQYGGSTYTEESRRAKSYKMPGWLIVFLVVFVLILVLGMAFSVLSILAPILFPVLLIVLIVRLCRRL